MPDTGQHVCAATHCTAMISTHLLMCRTDWALVPADLQARVYRTYRARNRDGWAAYTDAVRAAVEAVDRG